MSPIYDEDNVDLLFLSPVKPSCSLDFGTQYSPTLHFYFQWICISIAHPSGQAKIFLNMLGSVWFNF